MDGSGVGMSASLSPMQRYYEARAAEYDRVYLKPERQADLRDIERWLENLLVDETVLEIACGTGHWTQFIAAVAAHVVGVDSAAQTLAIARQRLALDKVELLRCDAYCLPAQLGQFTAAFAGFWFSHVPKSRRLEFLRGVQARLQQGRTLVMLDNRYVAASSSPLSRTDAAGNTYQQRLLDDGSRHEVLKNFPSQAELLSWFESLGLRCRFREWQYFWSVEVQMPSASS